MNTLVGMYVYTCICIGSPSDNLAALKTFVYTHIASACVATTVTWFHTFDCITNDIIILVANVMNTALSRTTELMLVYKRTPCHIWLTQST